MKKALAMLLALVMLLSLAGTAAFADGYTPGTYTGEAEGMHSTVTVTLTVDENGITGVQLDTSGETETIGAAHDEEFCKNLCTALSVPFFCAHINVPSIAQKRKVSFETAARDERYAFLSVTANKLGAVIATAHTANDNLETVLFNMGRGCGTAGLCGIPVRRGEVIRPLRVARAA